MTLKTSDMAMCAEVSQFTIREYGDQGLLGHVFRSRNNNYRSFDPRLIPQMYLIKTLRELGCTPQQIRDYGQNRTPDRVLAMLRGYSAQLASEYEALQAKMDILQSRISLIALGQASTPDIIEFRMLPAQALRCSPLEHFNEKAKNIERLRRAVGHIRQEGNIGCPIGYAYSSFQDLLEKPKQPAQLVSYDPQGPDIRPAGEYLVGTVACGYGQTSGLPQRMSAYAERKHLKLQGPVYMVHLLDASAITEPEQYLLQIAVGASLKVSAGY